MQKFLMIATQMFPVERIERINRSATINGETGVEVKVFGFDWTFQYTGNYATDAYNLLEGTNPASTPPALAPLIVITLNGVPSPGSVQLVNGEFVIVNINGELVNADNIEWVDFLVDFQNGTTGVELRVATDAAGVTRQYIGQQASDLYDTLVGLASNQKEQVAAN